MTPLGQQRLLAIVGRIYQDQTCWVQSKWHCGTAHCVAGHAQIDMLKSEGVSYKQNHYSITDNDDILVDDEYQSPPAHAQGWLELTLDERWWLFDSQRTLKELIDIAITGNFPPACYRLGFFEY